MPPNPVLKLIELQVMEDKNRARLIIFNRWGEVVFRNRDEYAPWDGKQNERLLPQGTYYYRLLLDLGEQKILQGPVHLLR